jgi:hypothetical protein
MLHALIKDGRVENVGIIYDGYVADPAITLVPIPDGLEVSIGWLYDGETFSPPPPTPQPVPETVTARQARLALLRAGLLDSVDAALAALPDPQERRAAQIEWEYATEIRRDSPLIAALAPLLGLTDEQVDDLFRAAAGL